jgi:hypothetical protein
LFKQNFNKKAPNLLRRIGAFCCLYFDYSLDLACPQ